jgi:hypothetical protein
MVQARDAVERRSWSHPQEPTGEEWWADVLADPRARGPLCSHRKSGTSDGAKTVAGATNAMTAVVAIPRPPAEGVVQALRVNKFDAIFMQRTRKGRNGRIAMRHPTKKANIRPSIPRMRKKRGESWSTNKVGTAVTIARKVSLIQSSIFSIQSSQRFSRELYQQRVGGPSYCGAFCRRRHQPRRPPPAKIRPGSPAPAMGPRYSGLRSAVESGSLSIAMQAY